MSDSDTPKKDENKDDPQPEEVEAEIVDSESEPTEESAEKIEAETVEEPSGQSGESDTRSFTSVGVILLGVMAVALIVFFLNQGGVERVTEPEESPEIAATTDDADEAELLAKIENTPIKPVDPADLLNDAEETADAAVGAVAQSAGQAADAAQETAESVVAQAAEAVGLDPDRTGEAPETGDEAPAQKSEEQLAEERRLAAIERARERREARENTETGENTASDTEDVPVVVAEVPTPPTETEDRGTAAEPVETQATAEPEAPAGRVESAEVTGQPAASDPAIATQMEALKEDVLAQTKAAMEADKQRISEQENEIVRLREEMDEALAEQDRRAAQLEARLEALQTQDVAEVSRQAAMSIAVSNLQRQMTAGRPFKDELAVVKRLVPNTTGVSDLEAFSQTGLPTMTELRLSYSDASRKALAAAKRSGANGGMSQLMANFTSLFTVRKTGNVSGDNPSAIISRAEVRLDEGDLAAALRELNMLDDEAAAAMSDWMEEARALVAADRVMDDISNRVLATM